MILDLIRDTFTALSTSGRLWLPDREFFTLEPPTHGGPKVPHLTAIPEGRYRLVLYQSPRLGQKVPLLRDVPHFQFIELHSGVIPGHTHGCILVGKTREADRLHRSQEAFNELMEILTPAFVRREECWITVRSLPAEPELVAAGGPPAAPEAVGTRGPRRV